MKKYILVILLSIISLLSFSQEHKEVFSKDIFISKELSGTIKLYDNGVPTFTPLDQIVIDAHFEEIQYQMSADTMKIFTENWSTVKLYPYENIDLSKMKDTLIFKFDTY